MASKKNTSKTLRVSVKLLMLSVISKIHLRITVRRLIKKYRNFHYYHVFVEKRKVIRKTMMMKMMMKKITARMLKNISKNKKRKTKKMIKICSKLIKM